MVIFIRRVFIRRVFIRQIFIRRVFIRRVFLSLRNQNFTSGSERGLGGMVENVDYGLRTRTADSDCRLGFGGLGLRTRTADSVDTLSDRPL